MSDTPALMLQAYRVKTEGVIADQMEMFKGLSASDQRELLFYMISHNAQALQLLHALITNDDGGLLAMRQAGPSN